MKSSLKRIALAALLTSILNLNFIATASANTRTLEFPFALSADAKSEFNAQFTLFSAGRISIEINWRNTNQKPAARSLKIILIRPNGSEAARTEGDSPLRLEYLANEQEIDSLNIRNPAKWSVKIFNNSDAHPGEVSGRLRITVPATSRTVIDTQFTLLGLGNAQEIPFVVPAPGKILIETEWELHTATATASVPLTLSLIHTGQSRTLARRQGASPLRIELQATAQDLDSGNHWVIRIQNDNKVKIKGRLKATYTPGL